MSDKGIMISLRIDNDRIRALAPLHAETAILGPDESAAIVAPADTTLRPVVDQLREALRRRVGRKLPVLSDASFARAQELPGNLIAVGHAGNNRLLRRLHYLRFLADADYASTGLRLVSVHNPFGDSHNVIGVLGAAPDVLERGAAALPQHVIENAGRWVVPGRLFQVDPRPATPDPAELLKESIGQQGSSYWSGRPGAMMTALRHAMVSGEERWARAFMTLATPYATGESPLSFWLMSAVDFWTDILVTGWDVIEEMPFFTDAERLLMANFVASCTEYCHDSITYQKWRITESEHQVFNHSTFPARGLFFGCTYLRRHGYAVVDTDAWIDKAMRVFARASKAGRSFDEGGGGYSWLVGHDLIDVHLAIGDTRYVRSRKMTHYADMAVCTMNNHFEAIPYGDCGAYHAHPGNAAHILLRAAEWHNDPGYKWVADKSTPEASAADVLTRHIRGEPPARHVGLFVFPLDPVIWRWTGLPRFPGYPPPPDKRNVPASRAFDKISLRGGWDPNDDYLLLQGFGSGQHGHPDANAISQYQARGRLFLVDNDYIRRMPKEHNMVMVIRNGEHGAIPVITRLDLTVPFAGGAVTQTTLHDYNGCDWTRTLIWLNHDCILALDSLRALKSGDYEFRCYWRTLGDAQLTDTGLAADHTGERFFITELGGSERRLDVEPEPLHTPEYPEYKFGDPKPKALCESRKVRLKRGDEVGFINLLLPNGASATPRRTLAWAAPGCVHVAGDGPSVTVSSDRIAIEGKLDQPLTDTNRLTFLAAPPSPAVAAPALPRSARRVPVAWCAALPAPATCLAPVPDGGCLAGCANGAVVAVSATGQAHELLRSPKRIAAVLAGRLWGEPDITLLATGRDSVLRLLKSDGTKRLDVQLPDHANMPGWGRALCLANLDGDGRLWPVVGTDGWRLHAVKPDGTFRWTFDTVAHTVLCVTNGDLNGDDRDEVVAGTVYYCVPAATADGQRLWQDEDYNDYWQAGPIFPWVHIRDVDGDGHPEVITAGSDTLVHCIDHVGEKKWTRSIGDEPAGLVVTAGGIVAASRTGDVHGLDGIGGLRWRARLGSPCTALAACGNTVCAATESGRVAWLDENGKVVTYADLPTPAAHLLGLPGDRVLAATAAGTLDCLGA